MSESEEKLKSLLMKGKEESEKVGLQLNIHKQVQSLVWEDSLEEVMATQSGIPAKRTPGTDEPGGLQSMGSQRVRHN